MIPLTIIIMFLELVSVLTMGGSSCFCWLLTWMLGTKPCWFRFMSQTWQNRFRKGVPRIQRLLKAILELKMKSQLRLLEESRAQKLGDKVYLKLSMKSSTFGSAESYPTETQFVNSHESWVYMQSIFLSACPLMYQQIIPRNASQSAFGMLIIPPVPVSVIALFTLGLNLSSLPPIFKLIIYTSQPWLPQT